MTGLLLMLAAFQGTAPTLEASVDPNRVTRGDEVVYVVRATSRSLDPIQISVPPFTGFQIVSRMERTELSGDATRTSVWEIHLRAAQAGRWQLGPARAQQGRFSVRTNVLTVQVDAGRAPVVTVLSPRVRRLLERTPPPPRGRAAISLIASDDTVRVGEQVDIVTAAWFPRELREELVRPPILQPPVVDGVWTYPQTAPVEVVATRTIDGVIYDLFAAPQVIFPLAAGSIPIPPATLKYGIPVSLPPFNREERVSLSSRSAALVVQPLPAVGKPPDFSGAVGSRLRLDRRVESTTTRVGEAVAVEYTLSGEGNTALWPAPVIPWPAAARAYSERVEEKVTSTDGRLGGSKIFRYLVVPDSVGVLTLPGVRYGYFDLAAGRYLEASIEPAALSVGAAGEEAAATALPPSLLTSDEPAWSWRVAHDVPDWAWLLLLLLPPLAVVLYARFPRRPRDVTTPAAGDALALAEERLEATLRALVPDPAHRSERDLSAALRASGIDADTAEAAVAVRARIMATRYGPRGDARDAALATAVESVTRRLRQAGRLERRGMTTTALAGWAIVCTASLGLLVSLTSRAAAQAPPPEELYRTGALHAAVEGFEARVAANPAVSAHWYGLGASYYRLGLKGRAAAAWLHARRLDPREPTIRRALQLTPPPDPISARQIWVPPVRPDELLLLGLCGWVIAWLGWAGRPRARDRWAILLVFSGLAVLAGLALRVWYRRPVALVAETIELRLSPHGRAPEIAKLEPGSAVLELRTRADWVLVRAPDGREGWLPVAAVASLGG